jgi:MYXO-CTERM domain-containing protein
MGGGCDPGLLCVDGFCIPEAAAETGASSATGGLEVGGDADDEVGSEEGLPADYGADGSLDASCACTSGDAGDPREVLLALGLLGVLGLVRRRSA